MERTLIRPPSSKLAPISLSERASVVAKSHIAGKYKAKEDRQSSYEILRGRGDVVAKAEAKEEEMEEEVFEVTIRGKTYFTADAQNGEIYEATDDGDVGDEVGKFVNGKPMMD